MTRRLMGLDLTPPRLAGRSANHTERGQAMDDMRKKREDTRQMLYDIAREMLDAAHDLGLTHVSIFVDTEDEDGMGGYINGSAYDAGDRINCDVPVASIAAFERRA